MKFCVVMTLCAASVVAVAKPWPPELPILDQYPSHVDHWLKINWAGAMNHPILPTYFMTVQRQVPKNVMVRYVGLSTSEYTSMLKFTHGYRCFTNKVLVGPAYPSTIVISEYSHKQEKKICVLPANGGCEYLFGLAGLPQIDWANKDTFPLFQFEAELDCKKPLTPWHGAQPSP
jgi:hypothetical protein